MLRKPSSSEKGQSMAEFAVGLVVLMILAAGIADAGRALFTYMALREAAQEGALFGSTNPTSTIGIQNRVYNSSNLVHGLSIDPTASTIVQTTITGNSCTGGAIKVRVSYSNFPLAMPFIGAAIGSQTVAISASATDTILSPACH